MEQIRYPLDIAQLLRKRKQIQREFKNIKDLLEIRVAVLGGSTSAELVQSLDVLLLSRGLRAEFYESHYNQFYEDAVADPERLVEFNPDIVYICTNSLNVRSFPALLDSPEQVTLAAEAELRRFQSMWDSLHRRIPKCTVLQNNFDPLPFTGLGNLDAVAEFGKSNFLNRLNAEFAAGARLDPKLFLVDLNGLAARVGLNRWFSPQHWYSYKMAWTPEGTALLASSVSALIASLFGRAKKCLVLDLDNTLWGGVIGDDGVDNLKLGPETPMGEAYSAFQLYCRQLKDRGILLAVCSKNDLETAKSGFNHPDSVLKLTDFAAFRANWDPKSDNVESIARELNIGLDSLVFVDDNPAERAIVSQQLPMVMVPEVGDDVSRFAEIIEQTGYFEPVTFSAEDLKRGQAYAENAKRTEYQAAFKDYGEYLTSLEMEAEIGPFQSTYLDRIAQLTNKSNQFNLTTKRYTRAELESLAARSDYVTIYGKLRDRFGDNGLVSVALGRVDGAAVHIELWLMSCRVLKRDMELAMLDNLVLQSKAKGATQLVGYYSRTPKNGMVAEHYATLGFQLLCRDDENRKSEWLLDFTTEPYRSRNLYIKETTNGIAGDLLATAANLP